LLEEALLRREHLPMVLALLADLDAHRYEPDLRALSRDPDPVVADAARQALKVLEFRRRPHGPEGPRAR
jgi:hypothetical protein